jgi:transketolase
MSHAAPTQTGYSDCRDSWAATITALAADDPRIVAVVNDSIGSSKLGGFKRRSPTG